MGFESFTNSINRKNIDDVQKSQSLSLREIEENVIGIYNKNIEDMSIGQYIHLIQKLKIQKRIIIYLH